ncbi:MAG: protein jag [Sphaerochaetaceae bacterium]|nr:protein jag [Sphaerochaetaceae bacterium]
MTRDFEGKTEQDAIRMAIEELHIEREDFDVEVIDNGKHGLFKRGNVKIRVHIDTDTEPEQEKEIKLPEAPEYDYEEDSLEEGEEEEETLEPDEEFESSVCSFIEGIVKHMGYDCKAKVVSRKGRKICIDIESDDSSIIIGRKGKNLDALQVLANVYGGKTDSERKIIVDSEDYRERHEEQIVRSAYKVAQQVRKTGRSRLLEPMNPYERRLVHTALNDVTGIETKSEGTGLYKQVRISSTKKYR